MNPSAVGRRFLSPERAGTGHVRAIRTRHLSVTARWGQLEPLPHDSHVTAAYVLKRHGVWKAAEREGEQGRARRSHRSPVIKACLVDYLLFLYKRRLIKLHFSVACCLLLQIISLKLRVKKNLIKSSSSWFSGHWWSANPAFFADFRGLFEYLESIKTFLKQLRPVSHLMFFSSVFGGFWAHRTHRDKLKAV